MTTHVCKICLHASLSRHCVMCGAYHTHMGIFNSDGLPMARGLHGAAYRSSYLAVSPSVMRAAESRITAKLVKRVGDDE